MNAYMAAETFAAKCARSNLKACAHSTALFLLCRDRLSMVACLCKEAMQVLAGTTEADRSSSGTRWQPTYLSEKIWKKKGGGGEVSHTYFSTAFNKD